MMHRTLLLTQFFPPRTGGAERYIEQLVRSLGTSVVVVAPPGRGDVEVDRTIPGRVLRRDLHFAGGLRPGWLFHLPWLIRLIRREHITRVIFPHYAAFVSLGTILRKMLGIPFVVGCFGLDFIAYRESRIRRTLMRWNLRSAQWIFPNSTYTADLVAAFGIPRGKIVLAPPGVPPMPEPTNEAVVAWRRQNGFSDQSILLTVGRLVRRKGHARVLRALPLVIDRLPSLSYVIVGDGPEAATLQRLVKDLGLTSFVRFLGRLPDGELPYAYHAADAFIMVPTTSGSDAEGFGIVYTEALSAGTPIIATLSGGVVDIIRHDVNGLAIDERASSEAIATAIIRLCGDRELRNRLGSAGRDDVTERFSVERQVGPFHRFAAQSPEKPSERPRVSIIIPVRNGASSLARTLHSCTLQTWRDLEIIVVDDGSTEDIEHITRQFPNTRLIRQSSRGAPAARNRGFAASHGSYVLFCDADVQLRPQMIDRLVAALDLHPNASYAYCSFRFGWRTFDLFDFNPVRLRRANYISTMSLIRRTGFPGFDESLERLQDWDLWLTMLERGQVGVWVPARLFSASVGRRGISGRIMKPPLDAVRRIKAKHRLE